MTTDEVRRPPLDLSKRPGEERPPAPPGPAWIVVPARVIALVIVLPFRLVHDLMALVLRGVQAGLRGLFRTLGRLMGQVGLWIHRVLLAPVGRVLLAGLRVLVTMLNFLVRRPLGVLAEVLGRLLGIVLVIPAILLWRHVLRPLLLGIAWLARGAGYVLAWLANVLLVVPARTLWRYVLFPVFRGISVVWHLAGRVLLWLWRTLIVTPFRVLIAAPARWVGRHVLLPVGTVLRLAWTATVGDPARRVARATREASRQVRLQLRRTFRHG